MPYNFQMESKGSNVLGQFLAGLLEGHKDAGFVVLEGAAHQEFDGK